MTQPDETPRGLPTEEPAPADPEGDDTIRDAIRPFAEVSMISEWINRACCERFVAWDVDKDAQARRLPFYGRTHTPLDIALMRSGRAREDECEAALMAAGGRCVTTTTRDAMGELLKTPWDVFIAALATAQPGEIVYGREVLIAGAIGAFDVRGAIDFVILMWEGPRPILRLVECKASRRDRTYQRIQVAIYSLLVRAALAALPLIVAGVRLTPAAVQCVVARIEEATNTLGDLLTLPPLDLTVVEDDVARFLAPDGRLYRIYVSDEDALEFQLDPKCDTCTNNSGCLAEAARKRQVQLIGCSTTTTRILRMAGVFTIDALADLDLAGATAQRIRRNPDFTEDLAVLQRRAQVRRTTLPGGKHALPVLPNGTKQPVHEVEPLPTRPLSQLPAHEVAAPEPLVRVFLEVSYDYVEDRVAAIAAHITASPHQIVTPFVATTDPATGDIRWTPAPEMREERLIRVERMPDAGPAVSEGDLRTAPAAMYGDGDEDLVAADLEFADVHAARRSRRAAAEGPRVYLRRRTRAEGQDLTDLSGREVVAIMERAWTRNAPRDTRAEAALLERFFVDLVAAIQEEARGPSARVHLYVWSRAEMTHLVEACRRGGSRLLHHLYQLLGCREPLEQLMFSCLQEEVTRRYALGWTGSGLGLAASLSWYGQRYHWTRRLDGDTVALDRAFRAGIFDFADRLVTNPDGTWATDETVVEGRTAHVYEIHARHYDTLPLPYLHAYWGILIEEKDMHGIQIQAIRRYSAAAQPGYLQAYLRARVHALRWIEDRIGELGRNSQILKRPIELDGLSTFDLDASGVARANRDLMRLEHHLALGAWLTAHLGPPGERLSAGRTIPVKRVRAMAENTVVAELNLAPYGVTAADLEPVCTIAVGAWVRLAPCDARRDAPQTYGQLTTGGKTGIVRALDWAAGTIELDVLWQPGATRYRLQSAGVTRQDAADGTIIYSFATVDESPSDYVADRVEAALGQGTPTPLYAWFDHTAPAIPPVAPLRPGERAARASFLRGLSLPGGERLDDEQVAAALAWAETRLLLVQGPPGTGKTVTAAAAIVGEAVTLPAGTLLIVSAPTHTVVNLLMEGIARLLPQRYRADRTAKLAGRPHPITLLRLHSEGAPTMDGPIDHIPLSRYVSTLRAALKEGVAIVGGTTGALLRGQEKLRESKTMAHTKAAALAVDEAAMMLTPHVVALATLLTDEGRILLAGDHRQLGVILTHDWEAEDRPNIVAYQPQASAYATVQALTEHPAVTPAMARRVGLSLSRRLPPPILRLVAPVYAQDGIALRGPQRPVSAPGPRPAGAAGQVVWGDDVGIYLVVHEERGSRRANHLEAAIVERVLALAPATTAGGAAIVTAHRAQRVLLRQVCREGRQCGVPGAAVDVIDTVNRVQGDERDTVIVTPATSDPNALAETAEFILDPHRANVAFTRSRRRLIVVCARDLLDVVPTSYERYQDAVLWKLLRHLCTHLVDVMTVDGVTVRVYTPQPGAQVATKYDTGTAP